MRETGAKRLARWLAELGTITDEPGRLTRTFLSPAMRAANLRVAAWMREAGLAVREDTMGNLIGRAEATATGGRRAKTLLLGSHLDTVRDAGRFDGALGVLLPIVALAELRAQGVALPYAVEVLGFSEEEGVRFSSAYLGSKACTGQLAAADWKRRDPQGTTVREAVQAWARLPLPEPAPLVRDARPLRLRHRREDLLGYVETHIEQGPVLEREGLALGVVSAIAGQTRARLGFRGQAGHAGTTPMALRRDALAGAAEFVALVEATARAAPPLVATVGTMQVAPGAANVIAGAATLSLDVRHPRDRARLAALRTLRAGAERIARRRGLALEWRVTQDNPAVACAPSLTRALERSVQAVQGRSLALVSGAGHDAVVLSAVTPVAMLFVRCRAGLSHHPDEYASPADLGAALRALVDLLPRLGASSP